MESFEFTFVNAKMYLLNKGESVTYLDGIKYSIDTPQKGMIKIDYYLYCSTLPEL